MSTLRPPQFAAFAGAALLLSCAGTATALTVDVPVTPAYLRENAKSLLLQELKKR